MVKKQKKYLIPSGYGGLLYFDEEIESRIKLKIEHVVIISLIVGISILLLRIILL